MERVIIHQITQNNALVSDEIIVNDDLIVENTISYEIIYKKYAAKMLTLCQRYIGNRPEANDIMHDGFIKVFMNIKKFRYESALETWITRIMMNTAITYIRKDIAMQFKTDSPDENILDEIDNEPFEYYDIPPEKVLDLLQELPAGYRTVLNLFVFEKLSHRDIAKKLKISESTSRTQFFKARKMLKQLLKRYLIAGAI